MGKLFFLFSILLITSNMNADSNNIKDVSKKAWKDTKEGSKEAWKDTKEGSKGLWDSIKSGSKEAWSSTKKAVNGDTEE